MQGVSSRCEPAEGRRHHRGVPRVLERVARLDGLINNNGCLIWRVRLLRMR